MQFLANPTRFLRIAHAVVPWSATITAVLMAVGLYLALFHSPPDFRQGETVRIMYVHVPAAWMAMFVYSNMALAAAVGLVWKHPLADLFAKAAAPLGAGFTALITPTLVRPEVMAGTGFLGEHSDEIYYLPADELYLTGTSEVALAGYHRDEIIDLSNGPLRYAGWSTCYRREAGSAGRDTRGILRVHQFNKLEMFSYVKPEDAEAEHLKLLALEEDMLQA